MERDEKMEGEERERREKRSKKKLKYVHMLTACRNEVLLQA